MRRERALAPPISTRLGVLLLAGIVMSAFAVGTATSALRTPELGVEVPAPTGWSCGEPLPRERPVDTTTAAMATCPDQLDGVFVHLVGEAIGDVLGRDERRWVQLNDDAYSRSGQLQVHHTTLGVSSGGAILLPAGVRPTWLGGPGVTGDLLDVVGEFSDDAAEDQGGAAVIATRVEVIRQGHRTEIPVDRGLVTAAGAMSLLAAGVWAEAHRHRRRW